MHNQPSKQQSKTMCPSAILCALGRRRSSWRRPEHRPRRPPRQRTCCPCPCRRPCLMYNSLPAMSQAPVIWGVAYGACKRELDARGTHTRARSKQCLQSERWQEDASADTTLAEGRMSTVITKVRTGRCFTAGRTRENTRVPLRSQDRSLSKIRPYTCFQSHFLS